MTELLQQIAIHFVNITPPPVLLYPGDRVRVLVDDHRGKIGMIDSIGPSPFFDDDRVLAYVIAVDGSGWADYYAEGEIEGA